jgi:anaerobic magnesium-protoporphyrin IX monomethyl ester cyclase
MGVVSLKDCLIFDFSMNYPFDFSKAAVLIVHTQNIVRLTNFIYGLEQESWRTIREKFVNLLELDSDILNACYIMPHFWTAQGRSVTPSDVIQEDLDKWSYRNQIVATPHLKPFELFLGVKLTEVFFHIRPRAWKRILFSKDKKYRQIMRHSMWNGITVIVAEIIEFIFHTRFVKRGRLKYLPDSQTHLPT